MAPIIQLNSLNLQTPTILLRTWTVSIFMVIAMVMSIVCIKFWWFKHRLNFDQDPVQNENLRSRSKTIMLKDKRQRQSQQVSDSIATHGVFRKRNEDELEIFERPKQLPPIREPLRPMNRAILMPPLHRTRNGPSPLTDHSSYVALDSIDPTKVTEENIHQTEVGITVHETVQQSMEESKDFEKLSSKGDLNYFESKNSHQKLSEEEDPAEEEHAESSKEQMSPSQQVKRSSNIELLFKDLENIKEENDYNHYYNNLRNDIFFTDDCPPHLNEEFGNGDRRTFREHKGQIDEINQEYQIPTSPIGFGKSIDEDWESFQNLQSEEGGGILKTKLNFNSKLTAATAELSALHHADDSNDTTFVCSIEELYDELSDYDENDIEKKIVIIHNNDEQQQSSETRKSSILKERLDVFAANSSVYEDTAANVRKKKKLKAQQKVTFDDVHTEEYYPTENNSESFEEYADTSFRGNDEDEYGYTNFPKSISPVLSQNSIPTPMQRSTKKHSLIRPDDEGHNAASLFSSKIFYTQSNIDYSTHNSKQRSSEEEEISKSSEPVWLIQPANLKDIHRRSISEA